MVNRLASTCPNITHLELNKMYKLSETGRLSIVTLLRQIVQNNPPIIVFNMVEFSRSSDHIENIGKLVFEILMSSSINSITDINFNTNEYWFCKPIIRY